MSIRRIALVALVAVGLAVVGSGCNDPAAQEAAQNAADGEPKGSPSTSPAEQSPEASPNESIGPPPLNDFENLAISALTAIGVEAPGVMEHGFRSGTVGGAFEGRFAYVYVYGPGTPQEPPADQAQRQITLTGGVPATILVTPIHGSVVRFVCSGVGYQVTSMSSDLIPSSGDPDESERLANLLAEALDCP